MVQTMPYGFLDLAKDTFHAVQKPLSINDLWKEAENLGYTLKLGSTDKTPWQTLAARLYIDIKQNPNKKILDYIA